MLKLLNGIVEFRRNLSPQAQQKLADLALGQSPKAAYAGCGDSRVDPRHFASTEPGDMFVHRNAGNLIPAYPRASHDSGTAAFVELALSNPSVTDFIVCGHQRCRAIEMLLGGLDKVDKPHLRNWLSHAEESLERFRTGYALDRRLAPHDQLSQINVLTQLDHLKTYPDVVERLALGTLRLHGWWFELENPTVHAHEERERRFVPIDEAYVERYQAGLG